MHCSILKGVFRWAVLTPQRLSGASSLHICLSLRGLAATSLTWSFQWGQLNCSVCFFAPIPAEYVRIVLWAFPANDRLTAKHAEGEMAVPGVAHGWAENHQTDALVVMCLCQLKLKPNWLRHLHCSFICLWCQHPEPAELTSGERVSDVIFVTLYVFCPEQDIICQAW